MDEFLFNEPAKSAAAKRGIKTATLTLVLAHGAGGPMDSPFMQTIAEGVANGGIRVARFEFPYMRRRRETGKGGTPDAGPVLMQAWRNSIEQLGADRLVIGGKSLGGRIASMIADEADVRGLVCLGYPFHPPGKPDQTRTHHLERLRTPTLILQGTRDPFGQPGDVANYKLAPTIHLEWLADGDHSFKPRVRSGRTESGNLREAIERVLQFLRSL
jgi:predicted alpha/beta-hydrolase family hydrolase